MTRNMPSINMENIHHSMKSSFLSCFNFFLISLLLTHPSTSANPVIETEQARFIGTVLDLPVDEQGLARSVHAYLGIPYAEPPVGDLRFRQPVAKIWSNAAGEPINATSLGNRCPQVYNPYFPVLGNYDEDCLNLDVYVPVPVPDKAAVMFWIHGGAFVVGTGSMEILPLSPLAVFGDVIVVAANYRLGALGFLSTGDDEVPGNLGLYDQRQALKWVQDNIQAFGGDPSRVTIFGTSAGGASVSCHVLSPLSSGLFSRAIMQSGVASSPFFTGTDRSHIAKRASNLGKLVGCVNDTSKRLVECLRNVHVEDLVNASAMIHETWVLSNGPSINIPWSPVNDGHFLSKDPTTMLKEGLVNNKVDLMAGQHSHEAMLPIMAFLKDPSEPYINATIFETILTISKTNQAIAQPIIRQAMNLVYIDDITKEQNYLNTFIQIHGDHVYVCPTDAFLRASENADSNMYLYHLTHHPSASIFNTPWSGACHADELVFIFGAHFHPESPFNLTEEEAKMSMQMMKFWSNFAKTGNPNKESEAEEEISSDLRWPKFTSSNPSYKNMSLLMNNGRALKAKECRFWNNYLPTFKSFFDDSAIHGPNKMNGKDEL
ncbi:acetylcholinesterase-like [Amphiura filiformis]|uniref:acetylcholinesterase-like n=1 Tax=Amphiura filiformis TaxID=82378 RepID=UPI003B21A530